MISPGILCTLMTCHGNWAVRDTIRMHALCRRSRTFWLLHSHRRRAHSALTLPARAPPFCHRQSSIALMDKAILPRPPLMVRR
jgi:hypothetical protein